MCFIGKVDRVSKYNLVALLYEINTNMQNILILFIIVDSFTTCFK